MYIHVCVCAYWLVDKYTPVSVKGKLGPTHAEVRPAMSGSSNGRIRPFGPPHLERVAGGTHYTHQPLPPPRHRRRRHYQYGSCYCNFRWQCVVLTATGAPGTGGTFQDHTTFAVLPLAPPPVPETLLEYLLFPSYRIYFTKREGSNGERGSDDEGVQM